MAKLGPALGVAVIVAVAVVVFRWTGDAPDGPEIPAWDREPCAHCAMHLGDPRFAAQLQTTSGRVHHFDDPGCLFVWREKHRPTTRALWFHHVSEDRWLRGDQVGFVPTSGSPMGYDLGAVDATTPGAISVDEAAHRHLVQR